MKFANSCLFKFRPPFGIHPRDSAKYKGGSCRDTLDNGLVPTTKANIDTYNDSVSLVAISFGRQNLSLKVDCCKTIE